MKPDRFATYVLNLEGSDTRLTSMRDALAEAGMTWERIEAVDGRTRNSESFQNYNALKCKRRIGRELNGGELGCYSSHLAALTAFLESDAFVALILEDDADLPRNARPLLHEILNYLEDDHRGNWDVVNLTGKRDDHFRTAKRLSEGVLRKSYYFPILATALLWSRAGATDFMSSDYGTGICGPYDAEVRSFCNKRGKGFSMDRPLIPPMGIASDIDASANSRNDIAGSRKKSSLKTKLFRHLPDKLRAKYNMISSKIFG